MPDNPHPHPDSFGVSKQLFLIKLIDIIVRGLTPITYQKQSAGNGKVTAFNYIIRPE